MNTERIAQLLRLLADEISLNTEVPSAPPVAPTPVTVAPKADYTLDDVKALINNLLAADANNKDAIKATIGAYAPALAQCSQMQLNAIADELEKLQ